MKSGHIQRKAASLSTKTSASRTLQPRAFATPAKTSASGPIGQHQSNLLGGIQVTQRATIQPKLEIGAPGDKFERQADRMAQAVMNMPAPAPAVPSAAPIQPLSAAISPVGSSAQSAAASAPAARVQRAPDYGNVGGPLAA